MNNPALDQTALAPAKLNLFLHILGRTENNYHLLNSLAVFTAFGDHLTCRESNRFGLTLTGPVAGHLEQECPTDKNLITRAINALENHTDRPVPFHVTLEKHIPIGAGLGGGSTDTATLLTMINHIMELDRTLDPITSELGSDITACLKAPHPVRMGGTGNLISPETYTLPSCPVLLVNDGTFCPTPAVYRALTEQEFTGQSNPSVHLPSHFTTIKDLTGFLDKHTRNDLTAAAIRTAPAIRHTLDALHETHNPLLVRLSGSGATCFAIYETDDDCHRAATQIKTTHPDWWVVATKTL